MLKLILPWQDESCFILCGKGLVKCSKNEVSVRICLEYTMILCISSPFSTILLINVIVSDVCTSDLWIQHWFLKNVYGTWNIAYTIIHKVIPWSKWGVNTIVPEQLQFSSCIWYVACDGEVSSSNLIILLISFPPGFTSLPSSQPHILTKNNNSLNLSL